MSKTRQARNSRSPETGEDPQLKLVLDLDRYVPALITFIANKLSRSATVLYQKLFAVSVTEWRILSLLAIEPEISAARICQVIGFDKGPVSRTLTAMEDRGLVAIGPRGWAHLFDLAHREGRGDPRQGNCDCTRTRAPPVVLPEQAGTRNPDCALAASTR
jgi:hypothetical protein